MVVSLVRALQGEGQSETVAVPFVRYRFRFRVMTPLVLPDYAGSMIRGAFGRALRKTVCMTHQKTVSIARFIGAVRIHGCLKRRPRLSMSYKVFHRFPMHMLLSLRSGEGTFMNVATAWISRSCYSGSPSMICRLLFILYKAH